MALPHGKSCARTSLWRMPGWWPRPVSLSDTPFALSPCGVVSDRWWLLESAAGTQHTWGKMKWSECATLWPLKLIGLTGTVPTNKVNFFMWKQKRGSADLGGSDTLVANQFVNYLYQLIYNKLTLQWIIPRGSGKAHLRARYPLPYLCRVMAILRILRYRILCSQPRTVFWILMQAERNLSVRSFSRYATWPARKKIFVFPNWNMSGSWEMESTDLRTSADKQALKLQHKYT